MPQSLTSMERSNPPPRRKSCLACTRARRRCDLATPACHRCAHRNSHCQYPQGSKSKRDTAPIPTPASANQIPVMADAEQQIQSLFDSATTPQSYLDRLGYVTEIPEGFLSNLFPTSVECLNTVPSLDLSRAMATQVATPTPQRDLDRTVLVSNSRANRAISSRLQYAMDKISSAPSQMVLENQTPWCHPHLYDDGMPRCMYDAISSAALLAAENDANARVIRDCIETRVQDLLSSPAPSAPLEVLARAQALFTYQILRLHDTDIRARASCDATMPQLEEAAFGLLPYVGFAAPSPSAPASHVPEALAPALLHPVAAAREFWEAWVFQESARRTLAVVTFFLLAYGFTKSGGGAAAAGPRSQRCNYDASASPPVTVSAHLWRAGDAVDFALAWRDKRHFVVHNGTPDTVLAAMEDARADDIDDFGKMILAGYMGTDEAKGWIALRGGTL